MNSETTQAGIDVAALEREIQELWKQKAEEAMKEGGQAVSRTCVLNLIVYAPGGDAGDVAAAVSEITDAHPCRSLVLLPHPEDAQDAISATVSSLCHVAGAGRQQVCSEQLNITARGRRVAQLPSAVRPLLISDLDTALWWRATPALDDSVFGELVEIARRIILDSSYYSNPSQGLPALASFVGEHKQHKAFSDLDWTRMSAFRRQLASFYDVPDYRPLLAQTTEVEIVCGRGEQEGLPGQALLAAGWLSARLGWKPEGHFEWPDANTARIHFTGDSGPIELVVRVEDREAGLSSIQMNTAGEETASFRTGLSDDRSHVEQQIKIGGKQLDGKIQRYHRRGEAFLLARELEILGHDRVYEQALAAVPSLVG